MTSRPYHRHRPHEACRWVDGLERRTPVESVPLGEALGRVLAADLVLAQDLPAVDLAGRDGYALRAADTFGATDYAPLLLRRVEGAAGIGPGEAAAVDDGQALPPGSDAILPLQATDAYGSTVEAAVALARGAGVVEAGAEGRAGSVLRRSGERLRPQDIGLAALAGQSHAGVWCRPRVSVLVTRAGPGDANGPMLSNLVRRDGGVPSDPVVAADRASLAAALGAANADLVLVAGATGHAAADFAHAALQAVGTVQLDGVAIHPGGDVVLGRVGAVPAILLPGTPLACLCAYELIAAAALRRLAGRSGTMPYRSRAMRLTHKLTSRIGALELARVRVDGATATPLATAEHRVLATAAQADGFVLLAEQSEGYAAGAEVTVYLYDEYD